MAPRPWTPGALTKAIAKTAVKLDNDLRVAQERLGAAVEAEAKKNARTGTHKKGEPTSAVHGAGPNLVTGTLRRSIVHTRAERTTFGWTVKVGMAAGVFPPGGGTPSSKYAYYLETVHDYPFLEPAMTEVFRSIAPGIWATAFRGRV